MNIIDRADDLIANAFRAGKQADRRVRLAWHVLKGRPLAYRMTIIGGFELAVPHSWVYECKVLGVGDVPAFKIIQEKP